MCVVSMIGDAYRDKWDRPSPLPSRLVPMTPNREELPDIIRRLEDSRPVTREEFDRLRAAVEEMKDMLKRAVEYDKRTEQPDCKDPDKVAFLKKVAELVGVSIDEVFR